jgi:hypothetical protein
MGCLGTYLLFPAGHSGHLDHHHVGASFGSILRRFPQGRLNPSKAFPPFGPEGGNVGFGGGHGRCQLGYCISGSRGQWQVGRNHRSMEGDL